MREVFCIVGLPAMGKTTLRRAVLQERFGLRALSSDHAARLVMEAARIEPFFSVQDASCWAALERRVDVARLRVWAYLEQLAPLGTGALGCDGWGFYTPEERGALEHALRLLGAFRVHYLHLLRPLDEYNALRATRGLAPSTRAQLETELARHDLGFLTAELRGERDLADFVEERLKVHA